MLVSLTVRTLVVVDDICIATNLAKEYNCEISAQVAKTKLKKKRYSALKEFP